MSGDPGLSKALSRALGEHGPPPAEHALLAGECPPLYTRVINLCRLVGEERFFSAAFSRVRAADRTGGAGRVGVRVGDPGGEQETWVLELDFEEVLHAALNSDAPVPKAEALEAVRPLQREAAGGGAVDPTHPSDRV